MMTLWFSKRTGRPKESPILFGVRITKFDNCVLDALRDNRLVIFAGAGVSMGPPSNLASFAKLASDIAQGTGLAPTDPLDRFLGQLRHRGVLVHQRAAQLLSPQSSSPDTLHYDLLRLFRLPDNVRLVTTNFDLHFEHVAQALFKTEPDIYRVPALPLGYNFTGIVYVHGALPVEQDLVLTDADFGRAYLTKGWTRRFLVDVFRQYTVLFVGYSHNDVVMNYLSRTLLADSVTGRFALTDEDGNWALLGIKPIHFNRDTGNDAYQELYESIQKLAERTTRGVLDWQTRLANLCGHEPPADEEAIGEVEQALREGYTTRFFVNIAKNAEWLKWLNARKHLDALFDVAALNERDQLLAQWLAEHFAIEHAEVMIDLIATHNLRMNPELWWSVVWWMEKTENKQLKDSALKRWLTILLTCAPPNVDRRVLMRLAKCCANNGAVQLTLKVFLYNERIQTCH